MSKRAMFHRLRPSVLRTRGAVVAAGMGAVMVVGAGAGVASADAGTAAVADPAAAVAAQAEAQAKAASAAKKAAAEKAAQGRRPAKKAAAWVKPVSQVHADRELQPGRRHVVPQALRPGLRRPGRHTVKAAYGGTVVKAGPNGGGDGPAYGNAIVIKHTNGKYSQYAHLSKINVGVGQTVKTGQNIAKSGNTGNSSGPHLHFEIRTTPNYGSALNPMAFLRSVGVTV